MLPGTMCVPCKRSDQGMPQLHNTSLFTSHMSDLILTKLFLLFKHLSKIAYSYLNVLVACLIPRP
jgi:hypothetical protein